MNKMRKYIGRALAWYIPHFDCHSNDRIFALCNLDSENYEFGESYDSNIFFQYYNVYFTQHKKVLSISANGDALGQSMSNSMEGILVLSNIIFICGGYTDCSATSECTTTYCIDFSQKIFKYLEDMISPRVEHSVCSYKNTIYAIGGTHVMDYVNDFDAYDILQNKWYKLAHMNNPRRFCGVISNKNGVYAFGGENMYSLTELKLSFEFYCRSKCKWTLFGTNGDNSFLNCSVPKWISNNEVIITGTKEILCININSKECKSLFKFSEELDTRQFTTYVDEHSRIGIEYEFNKFLYVNKEMTVSEEACDYIQWKIQKANIIMINA